MKTIICKCFQKNVNIFNKKKKWLKRHITDDLENSFDSDEE